MFKIFLIFVFLSIHGCIVNGLFLTIVGILTLILCRQQVYVLTSLFILLIFQLVVTIITLGLYGYYSYHAINDLINCFQSTGTFTCNNAGKILFIVMADLIHLFLTFCLIICNLVIIKNVRRTPIIPAAPNYAQYPPQTR